MKILGYLILAAAILAGIGYSYRATYTAGDTNGYNRRLGEEAAAQAKAQKQTDKTSQQQAGVDRTGATAVATRIDAVHAGTTNLEKPIYAPEPAPAPATRVTSRVFPVAFSVCWNAASTRDPKQTATCVALREHGQVPAQAQPGHD